MSLYAQDPTPCPQPRHGLGHRLPRMSLLDNQDPTVTLPHVGLRDAKPRRPGKRQSERWEPTIDICEDTFQLPQPPSIREARRPEVETNRRTTLFAQPAQRITTSSSISPQQMDRGPHKRRLSSVLASAAPSKPTPDATQPQQDHAERKAIGKEARRRTIYVPSEDTTIMTIHPGRSLHSRPAQSQAARQSDVFLDIVSEENDVQGQNNTVDVNFRPTKRVPRQSILAGPRRAPLQHSARSGQPQATIVDVQGSGDGKENVPPGLEGVKRLGKRASFICSDKNAPKPFTAPAPIAEESTSQPQLEPRQPHITKGRVSLLSQQRRPRDSLNVQARRSSILLKPSNPVVPRDTLSAVPETASLAATADQASAARPSRTAQPPQSSLEKYPVITEDITDPSLYEDHWLRHQEQGMSQLVNSLFHRAHGSQGPSEPSLAEQTSLRHELMALYQGPEMPLMHKRLQASLQFGALNIPSETLAQVARFKHDCGQRQRFLDLWVKTYRLEHLQIAAEVVVGRQRAHSPRTSGSSSPTKSSVKSIAAFLKAFLVYNEDMTLGDEDSPDSHAQRGSGRETSNMAAGWRRTALRSLMLIHLLDRARETSKLRGCLFQPTSPYKSSLAVLQGLCRLLIPSVGDVSRALHHLGYSVTHVQHPLDEYDYAITNLATDLRDGIRLTRLVELLLHAPGAGATDAVDTFTRPISQHLKHPCPGRAQKLHNAQLALEALAAARPTGSLLDAIRPADIVDGHREKTVRLLWALLSRWGLAALIDRALVARETARLRRKLRCPGAPPPPLPASADDDPAALLHAWAAAAAALHGLALPNLSTSFADGQAYRAILAEYAPLIPGAPAPAPTPTPPPSTDEDARRSPADTLARLGCSAAFGTLFAAGAPIPAAQTTLPRLAFLAARVLPAARAGVAARTIQAAWRACAGRRRRAAALLAREAALVVRTRERIVWAAIVLQRRWRGAHWL